MNERLQKIKERSDFLKTNPLAASFAHFIPEDMAFVLEQLEKYQPTDQVSQACITCLHNGTPACPWPTKFVASTGEKVGVCNAWKLSAAQEEI